MLDLVSSPELPCAWLLPSEGGRALQIESWSARAHGALSFYAPDFALTSATPWLVGQELEVGALREAAAWPGRLQVIDPPSKIAFAQMHGDLLARIASGRLAKAVPAVCETYLWESEQRRLPVCLGHGGSGFSYGFSFGQEGMTGVTPELLFHVEGSRLTTMALAGTGAIDGPSLLLDKKERHEHDLVIGNIVEALIPWGSPAVGETVERHLGRIKHLYTPITVEFFGLRPQFEELVAALHPTAALGGWPRQEAMTWLQEQDFHRRRRRFGAPFGFVDGDAEMLCVVGIRGLQWLGLRAEIWTGCGVVAGSVAEREWNELALKRAATQAHLGLEIL